MQVELWLLLALVALIFLSAFFSASETALFSISSMQLRALNDQKRGWEGKVAALLSRPRPLLVTILVVNVLMNLMVQNLISSRLSTSAGWGLSVGLPLALTLIFGEVIPKSIAYENNLLIARYAAPVLLILEKFLRPLCRSITSLTSSISSLLFCYLKPAQEVSTQELKNALRRSEAVGLLTPGEKNLIRGYLNLEESIARELICSRQQILFFEVNDPIEKLVDLFVQKECSQIPVCHEGLDHLLGSISSEIFLLHQERIDSGHGLIPFLSRPHYVPESLSGLALLKTFYQKKASILFVVDEYGSLSGLLTLEDLFELVTGQIIDSRDLERPHPTLSADSVLITDGSFELTEFERVFDFHLESPHNMATIGGWLTEYKGDIPSGGDKITTQEFFFHVLEADATRVKRVYIRRRQQAEQTSVDLSEER